MMPEHPSRDKRAEDEMQHLFGSKANADRLHAAMDAADRLLPLGARLLEPEMRSESDLEV